MKLNRPVRIVDTLHAAFHVEGWYEVMLMHILVDVSNRPEGVKSLMSGGLKLRRAKRSERARGSQDDRREKTIRGRHSRENKDNVQDMEREFKYIVSQVRVNKKTERTDTRTGT